MSGLVLGLTLRRCRVVENAATQGGPAEDQISRDSCTGLTAPDLYELHVQGVDSELESGSTRGAQGKSAGLSRPHYHRIT